ncbi:MAG: tetratricopeptide repeat protein [Planctomycetota bacterium]
MRTLLTHTILLLAATSPLLAAPPLSAAPAVRPADVEALIAKGRDLLDAGRPKEAEAIFREAAAADKNSFRTEMWTLRAWMEQGRVNDTLDRLDALEREGHAGADLDYLFGMAFVRMAEQKIAQGATDATLQMNFEDAVARLKTAVAADPVRYRDACLALGQAAWYAQDLETARAAIDRAVGFYPRDGGTHLMQGRIALSQFQVARGEAAAPEEWSEAAQGHWSAARAAFTAAMECLGAPAKDTKAQGLLGTAAKELGHTLVWKGMRAEAADAYAVALAWAPHLVDLGQMRGLLYEEGAEVPLGLFLAALEKGEAGFVNVFGERNPADATVHWWIGYTNLELGRYEASEKAYLAAVTKHPAYVDSWYYVFLGRYDRQDWDGAAEAILRGWQTDPPALLNATRAGDAGANAERVAWVAAQLLQKGGIHEAAMLYEICAETNSQSVDYWNNLGLLLRDEGDLLRQASETPDEAVIARLNERALAAYLRALDLDPANPVLLNDTAVIYHQYVQRDFERALAMYRRAQETAAELLARTDLSKEDRTAYETAQRDARNNERDLKELLAKRKKAAEGGGGGG